MYSDDLDMFLEDSGTTQTDGEQSKSDSASGDAMICPACGGRVLSFNWGFGCSNFRDGCKFSAGTISGRQISEKEVRELCLNGETGLLDGFTSKKGNPFSAKLTVDKNDGSVKFSFPERETDPELTCPDCGKPMRKMDWGYGCSGYPDCRFSVFKTIAGKQLEDSQIRTLIKDRELPKIEGFRSRKGTTFDAGLRIEDGGVKFVFE